MAPVGKQGILQRRNSLATTAQAALDGFLVLSLLYWSVMYFEDRFTLPYLVLGFFLLGTMSICYLLLGTYRRHTSLPGHLIRLLVSWGSTFALLLLLGYLSGANPYFSRQVIVTVMLGGFLGQMLIHTGLLWLYRRRLLRDAFGRALVIGDDSFAGNLAQRINANPWLGIDIVGAISPRGREGHVDGAPALPIIGDLQQTCELVERLDIGTVYFAIPLRASDLIEQIYFQLLDLNVDVHWAPNVFALNLVNFSVREIAGVPIFTLSETPLQGNAAILKWIEDKLLASLALLLLSPLMLLTAIAIKLDSPGPVLFRQARTGWDGQIFHIWKFRSMYVQAPEEDAVLQATSHDPRVTRVGRLIRKTSIDELPQLFNVLEGSMSMVGPRPHAVQHNRDYSVEITAYLARHRIKPGITGWAQVNGLRGETDTMEKMQKRVDYDMYYINKWSIWFDFWILLRTLLVLTGRNVY